MTSVAAEFKIDKDAIGAQLERLFSSAPFRNSRRSQALLRHVVEHYIESVGDHLKERTLGIEVFGRDAGYDTANDPIVRAVAGDIRKRLAQYYQEPGHEHEIRIDLPSGSYAPEFHLPAVTPVRSVVDDDLPEPHRVVTPQSPPLARRRRHWALILVAVVTMGIGIVAWRSFGAAPITRASSAETATVLDRFWRPIIAAPGTVQIELGTMSWPKTNVSRRKSSIVAGWPGVIAASQVMAYFQKLRKVYTLENANTSKLDALAQGPAVLIGASNNPWTLALTASLRFHLVRQKKVRWIADRKDPSKRFLISQGTLPGSVRQYALIARFYSSITGQETVVVAGMGTPATTFASEFLANAQDMDELARQLPKGWESKNIEAVISGQAVGGAPGAPHIVAVDCW